MDQRIIGKWRIVGAAGLHGNIDDPNAVWTFKATDSECGAEANAVTYTFKPDGMLVIDSDATRPWRPPELMRWWIVEEAGETYLTFEIGDQSAGQRIWLLEDGRLLIAAGPPSKRKGNSRVWLMPGKEGMIERDREWLSQFSVWSALVLVRDVLPADTRDDCHQGPRRA